MRVYLQLGRQSLDGDRCCGWVELERAQKVVLVETRPQYTFASLRSARVRRGRSMPVPAEPAERGPTRSLPESSRHAMEPPPAPTSVISTERTRIGNPRSYPPIQYRSVAANSPPSIEQVLAVVPPMSNVTTFSMPRVAASARAAITPATGPDSTLRTGKRRAVSRLNAPPKSQEPRAASFKASLGKAGDELPAVSLRHGRDVGVCNDSRKALELTPSPAG